MSWNGYRSDADAEYEPGLVEGADWPIPTSAKIPVAIMIAAMSVAWALSILWGGMGTWGVSASALALGRFDTIGLHMFAHGGLWHIVMNMAALWAIGPQLVARFGRAPFSWLRFLAFFILSGLAGMVLYLLLHPFGKVPMLGASGAIYGLLGLLLRLPAEGAELEPLRSPRMRRTAVSLAKDNLWLVLLLNVPALVFGNGGGLAWEAHLGGFLFGALVGPKFLPREQVSMDASPASEAVTLT